MRLTILECVDLANEKLASNLLVLIHVIAANDFDYLLFKGAELIVPRLRHFLSHLLVIMFQLSDVLQLLYVLVHLLLISFFELDPKVKHSCNASATDSSLGQKF